MFCSVDLFVGYNKLGSRNPRVAEASFLTETGERRFVMRKSRVEAAKTRERIVSAAATEFRRHGIEATGLADLMKAAGLTHGGFYKHFESKGQLVAEACAEAGRELSERVAANTAKG